MAFISILKACGYDRVIDVQGGFGALQQCEGFVVALD
jgi:hypothetical protein